VRNNTFSWVCSTSKLIFLSKFDSEVKFNTYIIWALNVSLMGFLDKLKQAIMGTREFADDTKDAAARAGRTVDDSAERAKRAADNTADRVKRVSSESERAVDNSAEKVKRAGDKTENAVDDADAASDELKKD
jgi:methyl-accepting chemotaxis protein